MDTNNHPKVSVIMPLYNQKRYLQSCLRSICRQSYNNLEIIVVNDGSTNDSPEIARKMAIKDSRIRIIDKENGGVASARRDGYLNATGEYITFIDNDDLMTPNAIEIMLNYIEKYDVDLVIGKAKMILGPLKWGSILGSIPKHQVISQPELYDKYYVTFFGNTFFPVDIWGRLYRKSTVDNALKQTDLYNANIRFLADDLYFNMKLFPYLRSMYVTDELVYYYRYGGTVSHFNRNYPEVFTLSDLRLNLLDEKGYSDGYVPLFVEYSNMVYYHAEQLIEFKKSDYQGIIDFFQQELSSREVFRRMQRYFAQHECDYPGIELMLKHDYDGMYHYADNSFKKRCFSLNYRMHRWLLWLFERV